MKILHVLKIYIDLAGKEKKILLLALRRPSGSEPSDERHARARLEESRRDPPRAAAAWRQLEKRTSRLAEQGR